jgi:hypothetical protein
MKNSRYAPKEYVSKYVCIAYFIPEKIFCVLYLMFQPPCMVPTYYTAVNVSAYMTDSMPTYLFDAWLKLNSYKLKKNGLS